MRSGSAAFLESALTPLTGPTALVFAAGARLRGALYDRGILKAIDPGAPVISVGNITAGGTGKTPIVEALARGLAERGRKPAIVSRGYGGSERGPARIPPPEAPGEAAGKAGRQNALEDGWAELARRFGDEPTWLSRARPETPVFVGRDRVEAARMAAAAGADCVVADDAFQHRRLARRFDAVVLDATEPLGRYWPLPFGRAREPLSALARAQAVILNKVNLIDRLRSEAIRDAARTALGDARPLWIEAEYQISALASTAGFERPAGELAGARVFCATGIGRPHAFRATVARSIPGARIVGSRDFPDHKAYAASDFEKIEAAAAAAGADAILVSEKDAIKMGAWRPRLPLWATKLTVAPIEGWDGLLREVDRVLL